MAKFDVGAEVFVPSRLLPKPDEQPFALMRRKVTGTTNRSVRIDVQDAMGNDIEVSSRLLHGEDLGITILRVGHFVTEDTALDPLAKSLLQFTRLLIDDEVVRLVEVRTAAEIREIWSKIGPSTTHVILVGHGRSDSFRLLDEPVPLRGDQFAALFENVPKSKPKTWVSLSCLTGRTPFAKPFSSSEVCADFFAPYQSVHVAAASQFAQTFFVNHLLNAVGVIAAHRRAMDAVGSGVSFRHWRDGVLRAQP
jgi:hypothetical protein